MPINNNPASRLCEILDEAQAFANNEQMRSVWAGVLRCDSPGNTSQLFHRLSQVIGLIQECKEKIQQIDTTDHNLFLEPLVNLEQAFDKVNLEENRGQFLGRIEATTRTSLKYCAERLSVSSEEDAIDKDLLTELQSDVNDLLEKVLESNLPDEVKKVLIEILEDIRSAILEYRIIGVDALRRTLESNVGSLYFHKDEIEEVESEEGQEVISKFGEVIGRLQRLVSVGLKAKKLLPPILDFLALPGGDA